MSLTEENEENVSKQPKKPKYFNDEVHSQSKIEKNFDFDDEVFEAYKISSNDSILFDKGNIDSQITFPVTQKSELTTIQEISINKITHFFRELLELANKFFNNKDFLNIYENFKPILKFFYKS